MTVSLPEAGAGREQAEQLQSAVSVPSSSTTATETACSELAKPSLTLSVASVNGSDAIACNVDAESSLSQEARKLQPSDAQVQLPPSSVPVDQRELREASSGLYRLKIVGIPAGG